MESVIKFLAELKANNNKEWFDDNRTRYQESKQKVLFTTELFTNEIRKFDADIPPMDPKDCLFRIFRDVRFSKNKTPYKINMGSFIAKGGRKSIWPGYYFHLEPGASFVGGGLYMPAADVLKAVRIEIGDNGDELLEILNSNSFKQFYPELYNDKLKTAPKGYPADHKFISLLRYKSFATGAALDDKLVVGPNFIAHAVDAFREMYLVNRYLTEAIHNWM